MVKARSKPIFYTIKELEHLYRKGKITYKELELYRHRPERIPAKTYEMIPEYDTTTKYPDRADIYSTATKTILDFE